LRKSKKIILQEMVLVEAAALTKLVWQLFGVKSPFLKGQYLRILVHMQDWR